MKHKHLLALLQSDYTTIEVTFDQNGKRYTYKARLSIGTGYTAAQRQQLWNTRETLLNKIVKYKHFEVGAKDAPRFPVWLGMRHPDDMGV